MHASLMRESVCLSVCMCHSCVSLCVCMHASLMRESVCLSVCMSLMRGSVCLYACVTHAWVCVSVCMCACAMTRFVRLVCRCQCVCVTVLELLTSSPSGLDDAQQQVASYEEKIKRLEQIKTLPSSEEMECQVGKNKDL